MMEAVQLANDMLQGHGENSTLEKVSHYKFYIGAINVF